MTGDDLITAVTEADSNIAALRIVTHAPISAQLEAANLLYLTNYVPGAAMRAAIVREVRE